MKSKIGLKINSFFQKINYFIKNEMFSKEYFQFLLSLNLKKKSVYINLIIYCLIIAACTIVAPLIVGYQPILFLSYPVLSLILVLIISVIASYITVEIFRTPIDDGTELISLCKPLHRSQIFFCKCLVLSIIGTGIALFGVIISTLGLTIDFVDKAENLKVIGGIFFGTIITFAVFGSITILFSLFLSKVISLLITVGISFLLIIISILGSLTIDAKSDVNVVSFSNNTEKIAYMDINDNGNATTYEGYKSKSGSSATKTPSQWYEEDYATKTYPKFAYGDFGQQLSSIYTLNLNAKDAFSKDIISNLMKSPSKLSFSNVVDFSNFSGSSIKISSSFFTDISPDVEPFQEYLLFVPIFSSKISQSGSKVSNMYYTYNLYSLYDYNNQEIVKSRIFWNFENLISNNSETLWPDFQTQIEPIIQNYVASGSTDINTTIMQCLVKFFNMVNTISSDTLTNYFESVNINNYGGRSSGINELNQIIYTGIYRYFVLQTFDLSQLEKVINEIKNVIENSRDIEGLKAILKNYINQLVFLRYMNLDFEAGANKVLTQMKQSNSSTNPPSTLDYMTSFVTTAIESGSDGTSFQLVNAITDNSSISSLNAIPTYNFLSSYRIVPSSYFTNFQEIQYVSIYNTYALFISWIVFSIFLTLISLIIYRQKDFK